MLLKNKKIKMKKGFSFSDLFFGRCSLTGYYNYVSGTLRVLSSVWSSLLLIFIVKGTLSLIATFYIPLCKELASTFTFTFFAKLYFSTVGVVYFFEVQKLYRKWDYLANLFNQVILVDRPPQKESYSKRDHLLACYAHDVIILGMWAHDSFKNSFNEVFEKAVISKFGSKSRQEIEKIIKNGIDESEAKSIIGEYICKIRNEGEITHE